MDRPQANSPVRRYLAYVGTFGITQLHLRNPWVIAAWSLLFPGFGHLLLGKYVRGYIFFLWEVFVNYQAHINLALLYTFLGDTAMAKQVLNLDWTMFYLPTCFFAVWDSYRTAIDINQQYILAVREGAEVKAFNISTFEFTYIDKRTPGVAALWSALMPGMGQMYLHRIPMALFILIWWLAVAYLTKFLPAAHYLALGQFAAAKAIVSAHWLLNGPSIHFFAIYDAYINSVEVNKLFDWEQRRFFNQNYQHPSFNLPVSARQREGKAMYIVATFEHSRSIELAVTAVQMQGVAKESILCVPLDKKGETPRLFDSIHHSDGLSSLDLPFILGTFLAVFGGIYGFTLQWGPIIWGLIAWGAGFGLGLIIKLIALRKYGDRQKNRLATEVIVIIECKEQQTEMVKDMLWEHQALGVRKLELSPSVEGV